MRVNTCPTVYGEKVVMRVLDKNAVPHDLNMIGLDERQYRDLSEAIRSPHGLMLVTGPTGSGKSTTLYSCLNWLNDDETNICTVEDPVEFKFSGINQVQTRNKVGLTFASALRSFLRQDPDVIMVGEVRDGETAEICMRAALTGHFVFSTLHTNDATSSVTRLQRHGDRTVPAVQHTAIVGRPTTAASFVPAMSSALSVGQETAVRFDIPS